MPLSIAVIYGSTRPARLGIRLARFIVRSWNERGQRAVLVDPLEHSLPLLERRYRDYGEGEAPAGMQAVHEVLDLADAFVAVSAEYNHAAPPALINLLDHYLPEYARKPAAIATYSASPFGGIRVVTPLRAFFAQLGAPPLQATFHAPRIGETYDEEGNALDPQSAARFQAFAEQVEWYARALKQAREES